MIIEIKQDVVFTESLPLFEAQTVAAKMAASKLATVFTFHVSLDEFGSSIGHALYKVVGTITRLNDLLVREPKLAYFDTDEKV